FLLALARAGEPVKWPVQVSVSGHSGTTQSSGTAFGSDALRTFITLGFVDDRAGVLSLTKKGKAFCEFATERGYVLDEINGEFVSEQARERVARMFSGGPKKQAPADSAAEEGRGGPAAP